MKLFITLAILEAAAAAAVAPAITREVDLNKYTAGAGDLKWTGVAKPGEGPITLTGTIEVRRPGASIVSLSANVEESPFTSKSSPSIPTTMRRCSVSPPTQALWLLAKSQLGILSTKLYEIPPHFPPPTYLMTRNCMWLTKIHIVHQL